MKFKHLLFSTLVLSFSCAFAADLVYTSDVKQLYLHKDDTRPGGRLLPTNGVEIIAKDEARGLVQLKINGWQNPAARNVLYYADRKRILVAAFAKGTDLNVKIEKAGKDGAWDQVSFTAWAKDGDFSKDLNALFASAKELYSTNCGACHSLHATNQFTANAWPATFNGMVSRTAIEKHQKWLVIEYLQKHAKDIQN